MYYCGIIAVTEIMDYGWLGYLLITVSVFLQFGLSWNGKSMGALFFPEARFSLANSLNQATFEEDIQSKTQFHALKLFSMAIICMTAIVICNQ